MRQTSLLSELYHHGAGEACLTHPVDEGAPERTILNHVYCLVGTWLYKILPPWQLTSFLPVAQWMTSVPLPSSPPHSALTLWGGGDRKASRDRRRQKGMAMTMPTTSWTPRSITSNMGFRIRVDRRRRRTRRTRRTGSVSSERVEEGVA